MNRLRREEEIEYQRGLVQERDETIALLASKIEQLERELNDRA